MEVDDEYDWLTEEAGFKLVDSLLPVSKRQQCKGLGPSVYISSFNSIEALERTTWHNHQVIHYQTLPFVERGRVSGSPYFLLLFVFAPLR